MEAANKRADAAAKRAADAEAERRKEAESWEARLAAIKVKADEAGALRTHAAAVDRVITQLRALSEAAHAGKNTSAIVKNITNQAAELEAWASAMQMKRPAAPVEDDAN